MTSPPLRIDRLPVLAGGLGLSACPGRRDAAGAARDLDADLDTIRDWGAEAVVTLIEPDEAAQLGVAGLGAGLRARGVAWHPLPVPDMQPPGADFERHWGTVGPALIDRLRAGGRVLIHCRAGLGRTGTVAARLLLETGAAPSPEAAMVRVRAARPGAIETAAQEDWLRALVPH
jgi:protein-tyrosine phosphatase